MTEIAGEHHEAGAAHRLERLVFFSDAVFAIAITLLVIELHPPHLAHGASDAACLQALAEMIPDFFGFVLSFFVIGAFWAGHHRAFAFAAHWDQRLIGANLQMLCAIAAMPFFTALNNGNWTTRTPVALYCAMLVLIALLNIRLQRLVTSAPVVDPDAPADAVANIRARGLGVLAGSLTGFVVSLFAPPIGAMALATILPWRMLLVRLAARKHAHG